MAISSCMAPALTSTDTSAAPRIVSMTSRISAAFCSNTARLSPKTFTPSSVRTPEITSSSRIAIGAEKL